MKRFDSINVIPFIDIMLVLLAIVLTTATFITQKKLDIQLPDAHTQSSSESELTIELAIDRKQVIYYDDTKVTVTELSERLSLLSNDTQVILRVDESVPFSRFVSVIDLLKQYQLHNLSILTQGSIALTPTS